MWTRARSRLSLLANLAWSRFLRTGLPDGEPFGRLNAGSLVINDADPQEDIPAPVLASALHFSLFLVYMREDQALLDTWSLTWQWYSRALRQAETPGIVRRLLNIAWLLLDTRHEEECRYVSRFAESPRDGIPHVASIYLVGKYARTSTPRDIDLFVCIPRHLAQYVSFHLLFQSLRDSWWTSSLEAFVREGGISGFHCFWLSQAQIMARRWCTTNTRHLREGPPHLVTNNRHTMCFRLCFESGAPNLYLRRDDGSVLCMPNPFYRKDWGQVPVDWEASRRGDTEPRKDGHRFLIATFMCRMFPELLDLRTASRGALTELYLRYRNGLHTTADASSLSNYARFVALLLLRLAIRTSYSRKRRKACRPTLHEIAVPLLAAEPAEFRQRMTRRLKAAVFGPALACVLLAVLVIGCSVAAAKSLYLAFGMDALLLATSTSLGDFVTNLCWAIVGTLLLFWNKAVAERSAARLRLWIALQHLRPIWGFEQETEDTARAGKSHRPQQSS